MSGMKALAAMMLLLVAGCFHTAVPAIQTGTGTDMGDKFQYRVFMQDENHEDANLFFERSIGNLYMVYNTFDEEPTEYRNYVGRAEFLQLGMRDGEPVYLAQLEDDNFAGVGFYVIGFLVLRADQAGVLGLIDCTNAEVLALAEAQGVTLTCASTRYSSELEGPADEAKMRALMEALLASGLIKWEDRESYSLYEAMSYGAF